MRKTPDYDPPRKQMTVGDLIAALGDYPPGLRVVVDGYEGGLDDLCLRLSYARPDFGVRHEGQWAQCSTYSPLPHGAFRVLVVSRTDWPNSDDFDQEADHA